MSLSRADLSFLERSPGTYFYVIMFPLLRLTIRGSFRECSVFSQNVPGTAPKEPKGLVK